MFATSGIRVRPRRDDDLSALLPILQRSHSTHRYPVRAAVVRADWLAAPDELEAWVAEYHDAVVGHVALHPTATPGQDPGTDDASEQWQRATGVAADRLAVVSRLVTDGAVPGSGTTLLTHAVNAARDLGRVPVLLVDPSSAALGFYDRRGWHRIGTAAQQWGEYRVDAVLMVAPVR
ncbi:GNAT family N-acetyltransferase [Rhodococcus sp. Leaf278]|uniref:GNAT family N-acetyltransferase n=1 Tax=Rhodococcus sp. Leaf278 TaxID=1736319 RepID=UPI000A76C251|nr:GNAT family N-acetyltransferase [Rhodococcus sp. Leaf278]